HRFLQLFNLAFGFWLWFRSALCRHERLHQFDQGSRLERFCNVRRSAGSLSNFLVERIEGADQQYNRSSSQRGMTPDVGAHLITVLSRHVDIGQNDARERFVERIDCCFAITYIHNLETTVSEGTLYMPAYRRT